jgi:GNAT superfamily N-acetyltransferase
MSERARHALPAEVAAVERALALAFADDPMIRWVLGEVPDGERVDRSIAGFFRPSVAAGMLRGHVYAVGDPTGDVLGASVWSPPGQPIFTEDEGVAIATAMIEHGAPGALERLVALGDLVDARHPGDAHFYLFLLGAAEQGRGHGGRLLAPVLERCDQQGLPAYLESSNSRNVPFYERQGFRVVWEDRPGPDGPMFRGMWRDPH